METQAQEVRPSNSIPNSPVDKGLDAMVNSAQTLNEIKQDLRAVRERLTIPTIKSDARDVVKCVAILAGATLVIEGVKYSANWLFTPKAEVAALPMAAVVKK
jgi:hypothetical protein